MGLFCHKVSLIINKLFPPLRETLYAAHVYGFANALRGVTNVFFTALKTTDPTSNRANIYGILTIHASQTSMNIYQTGAFRTKKFNRQSLHGTYSHIIRHLHCYCVEHT
jgi:hypothetical protein